MPKETSRTRVESVKSVKNYVEKIRFFVRGFSGAVSFRLVKLPVSWGKSRDYFVTQVLRRKSAKDVAPIGFARQGESCAIVMQGPIDPREDFTLTTVARYREWYPSAPIIVSTWNDQDTEILEEIESLGCEIVLLDPTDYKPGPANQNFQMVSTRAALLAAEATGSKFVLKTRSDQRINNKFAIPSLPKLLQTFPCVQTGDQKQRLVVPSLNTFVFRPYGVTDMLMFGSVSDMLVYWDGTLDNRASSPEYESNSLRAYARMRIAEVAFCSNFLEKNGLELDFSLEQYWSALAERFLVLDQSFFDLHWPKYTRVENRWGVWRDQPKFREVSFGLWVLMHAGLLAGDDAFLDEEI